jgi:23S rRNA (cytosine1962-C5)-methyltransferase
MIAITKNEKDYALLDSGECEKLERYGDFVLARPDPQALWPKRLPKKEWENADAIFIRRGNSGEWLSHFNKNGRPIPEGDVGKKKKILPKDWTIDFGGLTMEIRPTSFKHTGLFPEQLPNWTWLAERIAHSAERRAEEKIKTSETLHAPRSTLRVLNLFGYTGGATLACAKAGAEVVHLDGSKMAIAWARKNAALSGLESAPIRWILDDARGFLRREVKRGNTYDGIIMDPPAFGHGPKGELWRIEEHFGELLELCKSVLSDDPLFFLINGYASGYSPIAYENNLKELMKKWKSTTEIGELAIAEKDSDRLLPAGIFARWSRKD